LIAVRAPLLILAAGNPSRGDDAIGPLLAERLAAARLPQVEVIGDFQWQIENALDLEDRELVVFVDAGIDTPAPFELREVTPGGRILHTSHALAPESVLATYLQVTGRAPPPALLFCVRGESFELGEPLSPAAAMHLEPAWDRLLQLCESDWVRFAGTR
jgi:hydrogenase maturation protease